MSRISGFVPQQDLAVESLTVQEHMEFMVIRTSYTFHYSNAKIQGISEDFLFVEEINIFIFFFYSFYFYLETRAYYLKAMKDLAQCEIANSKTS